MLRFATTGFARGDEANLLFALGIYDRQDTAQSIHPQGDKPLLPLGIRVFDGHGAGIAQGLPAWAKLTRCFLRLA